MLLLLLLLIFLSQLNTVDGHVGKIHDNRSGDDVMIYVQVNILLMVVLMGNGRRRITDGQREHCRCLVIVCGCCCRAARWLWNTTRWHVMKRGGWTRRRRMLRWRCITMVYWRRLLRNGLYQRLGQRRRQLTVKLLMMHLGMMLGQMVATGHVPMVTRYMMFVSCSRGIFRNYSCRRHSSGC